MNIDNVRVGDVLSERMHQPTEVQLFMYNAAIWNPHRIHYDHPYTTQTEGHPGIVIDGPLQGDFLTQLVLEWMGKNGRITEFYYSNRKASHVGDTLWARGSVVQVDASTGNVVLELGIFNDAGEAITPGKAVVKLFR